MHAQLIPLEGGTPITITNDVTLVGRKPGLCDLVLDRSSISKMHCLLVKTDGLLFVRDLGSTNGTKVNGQRVTRGALLPGDELAFASAKFRVHLGPDLPEEVGPGEATEVMTLPTEFKDDSGDYVFENQDDSESDVRPLSEDSVF